MRFQPDKDVNFQLERILNNGIDFQDNIRGALIEVDFEDGEAVVEHSLSYIPIGYIVLWKNGEGDVWATRSPEWNNQRLYLASNAPSLKVRLFVM
jgi:hypothetical protein